MRVCRGCRRVLVSWLRYVIAVCGCDGGYLPVGCGMWSRYVVVVWLRYVVAVALAFAVAAVADARSSGLARKSFRAPVLALLMASVSLLALGLLVYV